MFSHSFKQQSSNFTVFHACQTQQRLTAGGLRPNVVALGSGQWPSRRREFRNTGRRRGAGGPVMADGFAHRKALKLRKIEVMNAIFHKPPTGYFPFPTS